MKKLVFIGNMAAPYMVKLCYSLQKYFITEFWFYEYIKKSRPAWWKIPLGDRCRIIDPKIKYREKYLSFKLGGMLSEFDPDIVVLGFFAIPSNYFAYRWAKKNNKKVILVSEYWRSSNGTTRKNPILLYAFRRLYNGLDAILAMGDHAAKYFIEEVGFPESKVFSLTYPMDLASCLEHKFRRRKEAYTYLFSHRLNENYNPILALEIFSRIYSKYPGSKLRMNASGPLRAKCEEWIASHNFSQCVTFLDKVENWNDLHLIYEDCDISLSPAIYSNGNISIVEAMASGMGIVMSNKIHFNDALIKESNGGFICEPLEEQFVECIEKYISSPELLAIHGSRNRDVAKRMSTDMVAIAWSRAIESAIR